MFKGELYDHKRKAIEELKSGSILCGGVGTGKSITGLAYYFEKECGGDLSLDSDWDCMKNPKDLYIITTAKKRDDGDWAGEASKFMLLPQNEFNPNGVHIYIDSWNNIKKYTNVENAFFIFDEQRVIGSGAWVRAFLKITKKNHWILLTATPADTWSDYIPVFIANGFYRNRTQFLDEHAIYNHYREYQIDRYVGCKKLVENRDKVLVNMEYTKPTVSHHIDVDVGYDRNLYKQVMKDRWDIFKDEPIMNACGLCYVLRRVVNEEAERIDAVLEIYESRKKAIVFYNFDYELRMLRQMCEDEGIPYSEWNGHNHEEIPDCNDWLYLVQYNAGAEGWNCIVTDTVIFFSQNYSYRIMTQAAGRIDRLDTDFTDLYYYHLKSSAVIDKAIARAIKEKRNFSEGKFYKM